MLLGPMAACSQRLMWYRHGLTFLLATLEHTCGAVNGRWST